MVKAETDTLPTAGAAKPLRILLVCGFFPPYSPLGAVRAPALVSYWLSRGHDVRVLTMDNPAVTGMLQSPLPPDHVDYVPFTVAGEALARAYRAVLRVIDPASRATGHDAAPAVPGPTRPPRLRVLRQLYQEAVQFPDRYKTWITPAVAAGLARARHWQPDIIYSSTPPHSGHVVAARLARKLTAPWIAESRDLWANNPYSDGPQIVEAVRSRYADAILRRADACVTLTQTASEELAASIGRPTIVSYNGFSVGDFEGLDDVAPLDDERLTIIHAGVIYAGRRDPLALFQALAILGRERHAVRVKFYHDQLAAVWRRVEQAGVQDCIEISPPVPRREILRIERAADVLLLCRWANPLDDGVIPGKLFEYIGARRPILAVGSTTGEAANIVTEGAFGLVSNSPMEIAQQLRTWIVEKRAAGGRLPDLAEAPTRKFLRDEQFRRIDPLLERFARRQPLAVAAQTPSLAGRT